MPPPSESSAFHLSPLSNRAFLYQIPKDQPIPQPFIDALFDTKTRLASITRTLEEISIVTDIVLEEALIPAGFKQEEYKGYQILGPMPLDLIGVINNLTAPLKAATVGVFVISTWNTDYLLVPIAKEKEAEKALKADGWSFADAS